MRIILAIIDRANTWTAKVVSILSLLVAGIISYEILAREVFLAPTVWAAEATVFGCGILYLLGGAWTLLEDKHVRVDMIYSHLSRKGKAIIDCLTYPFFVLYLVVMIWATFMYASDSVALRETTMSPWDPPIYPLKITMLVALAMVFLQGTAKFIRDLYYVLKGKML